MIRYTKEYIGRLLERYMDGTSTLEEEDILRRYFTECRVPAEWKPYQQLMAEIDAMKPTVKPKPYWRWWSMAAAVAVFVVLFAAIQGQQKTETESALIAMETESDSMPSTPILEIPTDSTPMLRQPIQTPPRPKRRLRKPQPTMTDYDKAYALMAQAEKEQQQAEQEIALARQRIIHTQLTAAGYVAISQEDGTVIYTNELNEYFAYEE